MTTPSAMAQRFRDRLQHLLDQRGVSKDFASRCKSVAAILGTTDPNFGARLLFGKELPNWVHLGVLCDYFQVEPGYFLDSSVNTKVPMDTEVVQGLTGGDPIAWRAPKGSDPNAGGRRLGWISGKQIADLINPTDFVIVNRAPHFPQGSDSICIAETFDGDRYAVRLQVRSGQTATFSYLDTPPEGRPGNGILPLTLDGEINTSILKEAHLSEVNSIVGTLRVAQNFKL